MKVYNLKDWLEKVIIWSDDNFICIIGLFSFFFKKKQSKYKYIQFNT